MRLWRRRREYTARSITERRSRGTRRSSNCFQMSSALRFLIFMVQVQSTQARVRAAKGDLGRRGKKRKSTIPTGSGSSIDS